MKQSKKKKNSNLKFKKKKTSKKQQFGHGIYDNAFLDQIIGDESPVYIEDTKCETKECCYRKDPFIDIDKAYEGNFQNVLLKEKYEKLLKKYNYEEFKEYLCFLKSVYKDFGYQDSKMDNFKFLNLPKFEKNYF